jgi:hypothetical protein
MVEMKRAVFLGLIGVLLSGCVVDGGDALPADEPLLAPQAVSDGSSAQCGTACNGACRTEDGVLSYYISPELITVDSSAMTFTVSNSTDSISCSFSSSAQIGQVSLGCDLKGMTGDGQLFFHSNNGPRVATIPMLSTDPIE